MVFVVSFFYFPIPVVALGGANTKMVLAVFGLAAAAWALMKRPGQFPRNLIPLLLLAGVVSLVGLFSVVYNGTVDTAYATYLVSMAVWLSAAFFCCVAIRAIHGYLDVRLAGKYIVAVCVMQCISALIIDRYPQVDVFLSRFFYLGLDLMKELKRMHGIGAGLDTGGIRFSICLIIIAALITDRKAVIGKLSTYLYILCYLFISVIGCMIARTTYVGIGLSIVLLGVSAIRDRFSGYGRVFGPFFLVTIVAVIACVFLYRTDPSFRHWLRFAFEGFFNLFEKGEYSVASTDTLKSMYVFPDNLKTWVIGDGYFSNPYWSDPNYIWHGEATRGYYKGTDVGYLRFIFYFGIIGLGAFSIFLIKAAKTCCDLLPDYKLMFFFLCFAGFVIWLKVASDVYPILALFFCVGNMYTPSPEELLTAETSGGVDSTPDSTDDSAPAAFRLSERIGVKAPHDKGGSN